MSISKVLKQRRKELDLTLAEIGKRVGVSEATVQRWESGNIKNLRHDRIGRLAEVLQVNPAVLMGWDEPVEVEEKAIPPGFLPLPEMVQVPIIGHVACGDPITAEENVEGYAGIPSEWKADFILVCEGDSMEPTIKTGDAVAIRKVEAVQDGQIAAVRIGDEATLKRVYWDGVTLSLIAENSKYAPRFLTGEQLIDVHIEGQAVGLCRRL